MSGADARERLEHSWKANADAWTRAVREGQIESRRLATDQAVIRAVADREPASVLDVGCGEGWLTRALAGLGVAAVGVDGSEPLIECARALGVGEFHAHSYEEIAADPGVLGGPFEAAVFNFSLLGDDLAGVLRAVRSVLSLGGALIIQTAHPWATSGEGPYEDGWRDESFSNLDVEFAEPMPWYFRTLQSWVDLLGEVGLVIEGIREPVHPDTKSPLSVLFVCERD